MSLSIIIPIYNASATLSRTLDSLVDAIPQAGRGHVQVVLVDDGSTDGSAQLVDEADERLPGFEVTGVHQANAGVSAARNHGLELSRGEWVLFLDADDELVCNPLDLARDADAKGVTAVIFQIEVIRHGRSFRFKRPPGIERGNALDILTAGNPYQPSSLLFRRDRLETLFDREVSYGEDWLFWASNLGVFEKTWLRLDVTSIRLHIHSANASSNYEKWGAHRIRVAEKIEARYDRELTRTQRNNLALQKACGCFQQRRWPGLGVFFALPCDAGLYLRFLAYGLGHVLNIRMTPY